ncbi:MULTISPECIES: GtrA family protein [unclassified Fibrobacter]|uniref:GtrA family protein n=1 Tax=unclassified Fibrobacter TaxID=2634177 RepID=UPI0025C54228|nr:MULTISPECIES: GtrA family protein [unclassified Fibrobacter]
MAFVELLKIAVSNKQNIVGQFLRYFVTGGLAFIVDFGVFSLTLYYFDVHYLVANLIGLMAGNVVNYLLSLGWVFSAEKRKMEKHRMLEITVFVIISLVGMGLNELLMLLMVGFADLNEMFSKVMSAGVVLVYNFLARKFILFKKNKR